MKRIYSLILFSASISLLSCKKETETTTVSSVPKTSSSQINPSTLMRYAGADYSQAIDIDTANRMILSYLTSINYTVNSTKLRSMTFDADTLRSYLANDNIKTLKFMLAHTPQFINSGSYGQEAGNVAGALTFIIVGLDQNDNYVYNVHNKVYDHIRPCPTNCNDLSPLLIK